VPPLGRHPTLDPGTRTLETTSADRLCISTPSPLFTVTIEKDPAGACDVHFHAGGQGLWVARMVVTLDGEPVSCGALGGESGVVLRALLANEGLVLREIQSTGSNGRYVHSARPRLVQICRAAL